MANDSGAYPYRGTIRTEYTRYATMAHDTEEAAGADDDLYSVPDDGRFPLCTSISHGVKPSVFVTEWLYLPGMGWMGSNANAMKPAS